MYELYGKYIYIPVKIFAFDNFFLCDICMLLTLDWTFYLCSFYRDIKMQFNFLLFFVFLKDNFFCVHVSRICEQKKKNVYMDESAWWKDYWWQKQNYYFMSHCVYVCMWFVFAKIKEWETNKDWDSFCVKKCFVTEHTKFVPYLCRTTKWHET